MKRVVLSLVLIVGAVSFSLGQTADTPTLRRSKVEQELLKLEREWFDAFIRRDVAALGRLVADDFISTNHDGTVEDKEGVRAAIGKGDYVVDSIETGDVKVRVYGKTAVITGRSVWAGEVRGIKYKGVAVRHTQVWVKRRGRWQPVAWQGTPIL